MEEKKRIRCLVLEDELPGQEVIIDYISRIECLELVTVVNNGLDALQYIQKNHLDLLFLDIHVPEFNGIEILKRLTDPPKVIFTTAFSQFAADGFDLDAVDYLVKPYSFERFQKAINKLLKISGGELLTYKEMAMQEAFIYLKSGASLVKVLLNDILFVESQRNLLIVHLKDRDLSTYLTINEFEDRLPKGLFLRIHKSFIVSLNKIDSFNSGEVMLRGKSHPIGRSYKDEAVSALNEYLTR